MAITHTIEVRPRSPSGRRSRSRPSLPWDFCRVMNSSAAGSTATPSVASTTKSTRRSRAHHAALANGGSSSAAMARENLGPRVVQHDPYNFDVFTPMAPPSYVKPPTFAKPPAYAIAVPPPPTYAKTIVAASGSASTATSDIADLATATSSMLATPVSSSSPCFVEVPRMCDSPMSDNAPRAASATGAI